MSENDISQNFLSFGALFGTFHNTLKLLRGELQSDAKRCPPTQPLLSRILTKKRPQNDWTVLTKTSSLPDRCLER